MFKWPLLHLRIKHQSLWHLLLEFLHAISPQVFCIAHLFLLMRPRGMVLEKRGASEVGSLIRNPEIELESHLALWEVVLVPGTFSD